MKMRNKKKKLVQAIALSLALSSGIYAPPAAEAAPMPPFTGLIEVTGLAGIGFATVVGFPPVPMGIDEVFAPGNSILGGIHLLGEGMTLDMTGMAVAGGLIETGIKNSITLGNMAGGIVTTGQSYFELSSTGAYAGAIVNAGTLDVNGQLVGNITGTGSMILIANGYLTIGSTGGVVGSINATCGDINIDNGSLAGNIVATKGSVNVTGGQGSVIGDKGNIAGNIINTTGNVNFDNYADIKTIVAGATSIDTVGGDVSVMDHSTITSNNGAINHVTGNVDVGNASTINTQNSAISNTGGNVTISGKNTQVIAATGNAIENTGGDVLINDKALVESKTGSAVFNTQGDVIVGGGILKSKDDTIKNVEGQVIIQTGSEVTSSEGWAISGVKGSIKIEEGAKVVGKKGAFAGATGTIEITNGSFTSTEGDGFVSGANQNGVIRISDTTVNAQKNGVDLSGGTSKTTTLSNVDIVAVEGNGLNVSGRSQVAVNGLNINAGAIGLVADNVQRLDLNTTLDDHLIAADQVGMLISNNTQVTLAGTHDLTLQVGKNGKPIVGGMGAGIQVEGASFDVNQGGRAVAMELTGTTAGLVGSGLGSTLNFNNAGNRITTATGVVADQVGGLLSMDSAAVNMDQGTINLVGKEAFGVQAGNGGTVNLSNLDDRFTVQATTSVGIGVAANGTGSIVNLNNTKIDVSGTGDASAVGLTGTGGGTINFFNSYTAEQLAANPKLSEMNIVTENGAAMGVSADGLKTSVNVTNLKNLSANATGTGSAAGLVADNGAILNLNDSVLNRLDVKAVGGAATGIQAGKNSVINFAANDAISVSSGADGSAVGVSAAGATVNLKNVKDLTVNAAGTGNAAGIVTEGGTVESNFQTIKIAANGGDAIGIQATKGSTLNLDNAPVVPPQPAVVSAVRANVDEGAPVEPTPEPPLKTLSVSTAGAGNAAGIAANASTVQSNFQTITIAANGGDAIGIQATNGSAVNLSNAPVVPPQPEVVSAADEGAPVEPTPQPPLKTLSVSTAGAGNAVGITADASTVQSDFQTITIAANGGDAVGIQAMNGSALNLDNVPAVPPQPEVVANTDGGAPVEPTPEPPLKTLSVSTAGAGNAVGIVTDGSTVSGSLEMFTVKAVDGNAIGIQAANKGVVDLTAAPGLKGNVISVSTEGIGSATGVFAKDLETIVNLGTVKSIAVNAAGTGNAVGIVADGSTVSSKMETFDVNAVGGDAVGIQALNQGKVDLELAGNATITAGKTAIGILSSGSEVNLKGMGTAKSQFTVTAGAEPSAALAVDSAGKINLTNMSVQLGKDTTGTLLQGSKSGGTVNAAGSTLIGHTIYDATDAVVGESNRLTLNLDQSSQLVGAVVVVNDNDPDPALHKGAAVDMNVNGSSSVWSMTSDSDLRGTLNNTGVVAISPKGENKLTYSTLKADKLTGNGGTYVVNTTIHNSDTYLDSNKRQADLIVATGSGSDAKASIYIQNDDKKVAWYQKRMDQALVITGPNSTEQFTLANGQNSYELGSWAYQLTSEQISQAEADQLYGGNYTGSTGWHLQTFDLSNQAVAALSSAVSPDIWYLETNALYSNIGQYDRSKDDRNVWAQAMHGKIKSNDTISHAGYNGKNNLEQKFTGLTAGIDKKISSNANGDFWGGLMFGHGTGDISYYGGSTDTKSTHVGLYGIYRAANDWYMGGVLKYNRYSNDISATSRANTHIGHDYSQHGWGASIMAGKKIVRDNGWFVEPQIEFGYNKVNGASYTFENGMDVHVGDSSSLRLRGGVAIGRQHVYNDGAKLDTYLKLSVVHEFQGDSTVNLYGEPFKVDYGGTWGQYKLGMNFASAKNTDFNLALTYEKGGDRKSPLGVEAGVKWSF